MNLARLGNYIEDRELFCALKYAFENLYSKDKDLIDFNAIDDNSLDKRHHAGERSIVFRFAFYFQDYLYSKSLYTGYSVDCEYNRNGDKPKYVASCKHGVYPDLILHRRKYNYPYNVLVMEFKSYWNRQKEKDLEKLKDFTDMSIKDRDRFYGFIYGIFVIIEKEGPIFTLVRDGKEIE